MADLTIFEDFKGPGRYILVGYGHDHEVMLNAQGDGTSTPSLERSYWDDGDEDDTEPQGHVHEVVGGYVRAAGKYGHSHSLEPAHAATEADETPEQIAEGAKVLTCGELFGLEAADEDYQTEAALTAAQRKALPASVFCGPSRSFPCDTAERCVQALRFLSRYKGPGDKARIKACILRKQKAMAAKEASETPTAAREAARLVDSELQVEMGLYPYPTTAEQLEQVLAQVEALNHPPAEKEAILAQLARATGALWQADKYPEVKAAEAEAPVLIQVDGERRGLVYAALQHAALIPAGAPKETAPPETPPAPPSTELPDFAAKLEESLAPLLAEIKQLKEARNIPDLAVISNNLTEAEKRAATAEGALLQALAESVALYEYSLRKPSLKGRSVTERAEQLVARGAQYLGFQLEDLRDELAGTSVTPPAPPSPPAPALPVLQDPTVEEQQEADETIVPDPDEPLATLGELEEELPEEGELSTVYLFHPFMAPPQAGAAQA